MAMGVDAATEEQIKAEVEEWSSNSNECTTIELVRNDGSVAASFQPEFTYPIFGDEEAIFGYHDLKVTLSFAAHNLKPHVAITHSEVYPTLTETIRPTDIKEALKDFLPTSAFNRQKRQEALHDADAAKFKPPGEKTHEYTKNGDRFEVWCAGLADPEAKELLENIQILMPMFIEGGSTLQLDYEWTTARWKVFFLYKVETPQPDIAPYSLIGYGTSYRVFTLLERKNPSDLEKKLLASSDVDALLGAAAMTVDMTPLSLPSRERLSQFLILPSFHRNGHGRELYRAMYSTLTRLPNVCELTVEDPNESFDDLRDLCDMLALRKRADFAGLKINTAVTSEKIQPDKVIPMDLLVAGDVRERIRVETKIMQRQFDRLVEAHTLSLIPSLNRSRNRITRKEKSSNEHDKAYYLWRLYAKHRLYNHNRDQLSQMEREEKIEKLEAALDSVQEGYLMLLEKVEAAESSDDSVEGASSVAIKRKRRTILDDEDADEDEDDDGLSNGHKKSRVD